jgi:hypothetical protein
VTGAAAGAVLALLVGLGSRLALVSEASRVAVLPARNEGKLEPIRDHAHAS